MVQKITLFLQRLYFTLGLSNLPINMDLIISNYAISLSFPCVVGIIAGRIKAPLDLIPHIFLVLTVHNNVLRSTALFPLKFGGDEMFYAMMDVKVHEGSVCL